MILLRRGRPAPPAGSIDIDILFDLEPASRRRMACIAPWRPPIEVFETKDHLVIRAEIGGLSIEEIEVQVDGGSLFIRGERTISRPDETRVYHESRVRYGPFEASVRLPFPIDASKANADYVDGILAVRLPRLAATQVTTRDSGTVGSAQRGGQ